MNTISVILALAFLIRSALVTLLAYIDKGISGIRFHEVKIKGNILISVIIMCVSMYLEM